MNTGRRTRSDNDLEGWFTDPFALYEARWLSDGKPTKLVRDGDTTSCEDPPDGPWVKAPERLESDPAATYGNDLMRPTRQSPVMCTTRRRHVGPRMTNSPHSLRVRSTTCHEARQRTSGFSQLAQADEWVGAPDVGPEPLRRAFIGRSPVPGAPRSCRPGPLGRRGLSQGDGPKIKKV